MPYVTTVYCSDGSVRRILPTGCVDNTGVARRASWVEPVSNWHRMLFHSLRRMFGDNGHVAEKTRSWDCKWQARMLVGSCEILGPFDSRQAALEAETDWLINNWATKD